jgi:quercetin 2,3-dioxygenase
VMNTQQEIAQAFNDYQTGKNGFEGAEEWESKIKDLRDGKKYEEL